MDKKNTKLLNLHFPGVGGLQTSRWLPDVFFPPPFAGLFFVVEPFASWKVRLSSIEGAKKWKVGPNLGSIVHILSSPILFTVSEVGIYPRDQ